MIVSNERTIFANGFFYIGNVATVLFSSLFTVSGIRISRILKHVRIHGAIFFCFKTTLSIFNNGLLGNAAEKQLVFFYVIKAAITFFNELVSVIKQCLNAFIAVNISAVIDDFVEIIWIIIVLQRFDQIIMTVFMKPFDQP